MRRYLLPLSALVVFAGMAISVSAQVPRARIAPEAWFRTVPTSSSLLGTYHWIDLSGDSVTTVSRNRNNPTLVNTNALPFLDTHSTGTILQFPCPRNCHRNLCPHSNHLLLRCGTFWLKGTKWRRNSGRKG